MIVYMDSSVVARVYFADEPDHQRAASLLDDTGLARVTGTWTKIEVTGAIVRAGRTGRIDPNRLMALLEDDLDEGGRISEVSADQGTVEDQALRLVRQYGMRAMDAWHLAVAVIVVPLLADADETIAFASRDASQGEVAALLGFEVL